MAEGDEERDRNPEDEFRDMLRELLSGSGGIDPSKLADAAGLPSDPASLAAIFSQLQQATCRQPRTRTTDSQPKKIKGVHPCGRFHGMQCPAVEVGEIGSPLQVRAT